MTNQHFTVYKSKLTLEAILRALLCGLAVGFGVDLLLGLVFWFVGIEILWILFAVAFGVTAIAAALFYLARFRPTDMSSARRLDRLGLQERLVTMVELEGEDSCMANVQRANAQAALKKIDKKQLKIKISKSIAVTCTVFFILGAGMITVNALTKYGFLPGGDDIINDIINDEFTEYVTVTYEVEDGGTIDGDDVQDIVKGTDTTTVTAVADEGFMFKEWSDGNTSPTRFDQKVNESVVYTAIFLELEDEEDEEKESGEGDSDQAGENPGGSQDEGGENAPSGDGEFNPNATAGGGQRDPNNQVINGETYYREVLEYYQELVSGQIEDNDGLSDAEIDIIKKYLGIV